MSAFLNLTRPHSEKGGGNLAHPAPQKGHTRSANSGYCTQPCRWSWGLVEEKRPGEVFPVQQDGRGTYIFNSKDLCLLEEIGALAGIGIASFKIEGRMKGSLYLASVTRAYRQAIDRCADRRTAYRVQSDWIEDVQRVSHRPYTKGHLFENALGREPNIEPLISYVQTHALAGIVRLCPDLDSVWEEGRAGEKILLEVRSRLIKGQRLEFMYPDGSSAYHLLDSFEDLNGNRLAQAHPNSWIRFCVDFPVFGFQTVRLEKSETGKAAEAEFLELCGALI
jgi:putative protease